MINDLIVYGYDNDLDRLPRVPAVSIMLRQHKDGRSKTDAITVPPGIGIRTALRLLIAASLAALGFSSTHIIISAAEPLTYPKK